MFGTTREILRRAGPSVARRQESVGFVAIDVLNKGLRPFLAKWHPLLLSHEQKRSVDTEIREQERRWELQEQLRMELSDIQLEMAKYVEGLAVIAGLGRR